MGMIEGILGLKFSIPGYFWVPPKNILAKFSWLDLVGFLGGIQNNPKIRARVVRRSLRFIVLFFNRLQMFLQRQHFPVRPSSSVKLFMYRT